MAYGKQGWGQQSNKNTGNKIDYKEKFLKLTDGKKKVSHTIRVVSELYTYLTHQVFFDGDTGNSAIYGRNIRCCENDCPLCAAGNKAKQRFYIAVIVKKTNEVKFLDMKWGLKSAIESVKDDPKFEELDGEINPTEVDIKVIVSPESGPSGFYKCFAGDKKPLTAEQIQLVEESNFDEELEKMIVPPTPKEVQESIKRIESWIAKNSNKKEDDSSEEVEEEKPQKTQMQKQKTTKQTKATDPVEDEDTEEKEEASTSDDEDEEFNFKKVKK
jgi:hypothetical protein